MLPVGETIEEATVKLKNKLKTKFIPHADKAKYFGVNLDAKLSWSAKKN